MACLPCKQKRLDGARRTKPLLVGSVDPTVHYVVLLQETDWGFNVGQRIFLTGTGVQELIDNGTVRLV